jgi:hypothetical protein
MAPILATGLVSFADNFLQNLTSRPQAAAPAQNQVDFQAMLDKTASSIAAQLNAQLATPLTAEAVKQRLGELPEVQAALAGTLPGQQMTFSISADGQLSRVMPNGAKETLALSSQSRSLVQQLATAINPGGGFSATLTSQRILS